MNWNIFKNIFLGCFGVGVIAILLTIASCLDETITEDKFIVGYMSITWAFYIACKIGSEDYITKQN